MKSCSKSVVDSFYKCAGLLYGILCPVVKFDSRDNFLNLPEKAVVTSYFGWHKPEGRSRKLLGEIFYFFFGSVISDVGVYVD